MVICSSSTGTSVIPSSRAIATLELEVPKSIPQETKVLTCLCVYVFTFAGRKVFKH